MNKEQRYPLLDSLASQVEEKDRWDGDFPGTAEDMAHASRESLEKIQELRELLEELDISF